MGWGPDISGDRSHPSLLFDEHHFYDVGGVGEGLHGMELSFVAALVIESKPEWVLNSQPSKLQHDQKSHEELWFEALPPLLRKQKHYENKSLIIISVNFMSSKSSRKRTFFEELRMKNAI